MHLMTLGVVNDRGDNDGMIDDRHIWRWSGGCAGPRGAYAAQLSGCIGGWVYWTMLRT